MSWIQKLYDTYEFCVNAPQFQKELLLPVGHTEQQAHIEIVLDRAGNFQRAALVPKESTVVPATLASAGRTGKNPLRTRFATKSNIAPPIMRRSADSKIPFSLVTSSNSANGHSTTVTQRSLPF